VSAAATTGLMQRFSLSALLARLRGKPGDDNVPIHDWRGPSAAAPTRIAGFDQALVACVIAMLAFSLVMVYSASVALPDSPKFARYAPTFFLMRQAMFVAIALVAALLTVQVPSASGRPGRRGCLSRRCCCWPSSSCRASAKA